MEDYSVLFNEQAVSTTGEDRDDAVERRHVSGTDRHRITASRSRATSRSWPAGQTALTMQHILAVVNVAWIKH
jgi:hypothetical protein